MKKELLGIIYRKLTKNASSESEKAPKNKESNQAINRRERDQGKGKNWTKWE